MNIGIKMCYFSQIKSSPRIFEFLKTGVFFFFCGYLNTSYIHNISLSPSFTRLRFSYIYDCETNAYYYYYFFNHHIRSVTACRTEPRARIIIAERERSERKNKNFSFSVFFFLIFPPIIGLTSAPAVRCRCRTVCQNT